MLAIIISSVLGVCGILWPALVLWAVYGLANIAMTMMAVISCKERNIWFICLPALFLMLNVWYGVGTIVGIEKMIVLRIQNRTV